MTQITNENKLYIDNDRYTYRKPFLMILSI